MTVFLGRVRKLQRRNVAPDIPVAFLVAKGHVGWGLVYMLLYL
jgi:hypothetical protein